MISNRRLHIDIWRELTATMIVLMEVSWVTPWFKALIRREYIINELATFIFLFLTVLIANYLIRYLDYKNVKQLLRQGLMSALMIVIVFTGIKVLLYSRTPISILDLLNQPLRSFADLKFILPAEFVIILCILIGFLRGISIAHDFIGPLTVKDHFWFGMFMYAVYILLFSISTGETPGIFFYIFLFCSLIAMTTARMSVIGMLRGGKENQINGFWLTAIALSAFIIVSLSALLGNQFVNQYKFIGLLLLKILQLILTIFGLLFIPLLALIELIVKKLIEWIGGLGTFTISLNNLGKLLSKINEITNEPMLTLSPQWISTIKVIIFSSIIIVLMFFISLWMVQNIWKKEYPQNSIIEDKTAIDKENLLDDLLSQLRNRWKKGVNTIKYLTDHQRRQRIRAAARIRQVYADLMELCDAMGKQRPAEITPLEFLPKLYNIFPGLQTEVQLITNAYNQVRYGQLPEKSDEIMDVELAWKKVNKSGNDQLSMMRKSHDKVKVFK